MGQSKLAKSEEISMNEKALLLEATTQIEILKDCKKESDSLFSTTTEEKLSLEKTIREQSVNEKGQHENKLLKGKILETEKEMKRLMKSLTELKNEYESNKNNIVAIRTERDDAMELTEKLFENEDSLSVNINRLVFDNKTLETKMTDAEITLSAKNEELERIRNDAIVLTQDEIENEKVMRDKNISQKTLMESLPELQNKYESNKNTIVAITTERDDAMELSEKLSENEDSLSVIINRLVFDNKTLETKMTVAEITLLNKNIELERIRNDAIVLTQEKIENEKVMRGKNISQDNEMQSLMKSLTELRNECESNKNTIVAITTERDDAME